MSLDQELQRQAFLHGVADTVAGVPRLQIITEDYDAKYWTDYRAGVAAFQEAQADIGRGDWYRPEPVHATPERQPGAYDPDDGRSFAERMLDEMLASGECYLAPTVLENYAASRMAELGRQWAADPPDGFRDGPEAG